ncbi:DUF6160 family protein [Marinobacter mobilis]|uniref:DUF6160 domain-containing protein n=1 Tax=Marinobacter mobilis TaxID=488533 RepID=A0A1H2V1B8_9GAMM|nr:DUF6160 family protein [Marinobacter mobilis]SDW62091.1 hypothetical protein SAMN04487960_103297 [Marinobacter mobilis]
MKGLKKIALATAVAAVPFAAQAELKAMDDATLGSVTGQSGITIELAANVSVGEVAYQDDGFLAITGLSIGGATPGTALDDIKLTIDVAGAGGAGVGAGPTAGLMGTNYLATAAPAVGATWADTNPNNREAGMPTVQDGDLVIGLRSLSGNPVDYGLGVQSVALHKSTGGTIGDLASTAGTTLISDLYIAGALGPIDIVIQEDTNVMNIGAYFNAQGSLNANFVGTYLDFALHNSRGADQNSLNGAVSFAYAQVDIGLATNAAGEDALAFNVNNFSGDLDLTNIRMGNAANPSIGNVYMTDVAVNAQMTVYGH